jgi:multimeric flavodoxin WrbA
MKVLMINGSSHKAGCTYTALNEIAQTLTKHGIASEIYQLGGDPVRDCIACGGCRRQKNRCVFADDPVNVLIEKAQEADGFVFGSPVYYAHPSGRLLSVLDRMFYAADKEMVFAGKPGAAIVSARRAGTTASIDVLNKYFTISKMPIVSSQYWNMVHGNTPDEVRQDKEGLQIMRTIGEEMAWLLHQIEAGKAAGFSRPQLEERASTNFIR